MPIYEYRCTQCGRRTEAFQKVSEPALVKCRFCGGALKKLLSPPAIQFKGNGWYVTDYARKSPAPKVEKKESEGKDKPSPAASSGSKK
jgi:putative FmdB family regulatory protein